MRTEMRLLLILGFLIVSLNLLHAKKDKMITPETNTVQHKHFIYTVVRGNWFNLQKRVSNAHTLIKAFCDSTGIEINIVEMAVYDVFKPPFKIIAKVGFEVIGAISADLPKSIAYMLIPERKVCSMIHIGPYIKIGKTYTMIKDHIKTMGFEPAPPPTEYYLVSDGDKNQYQTLIEYPF